MTNLENAILETIQKYHSFSIDDIKNAYCDLRSFDLILAALKVTTACNVSLHDTVYTFKEEPAKELIAKR